MKRWLAAATAANLLLAVAGGGAMTIAPMLFDSPAAEQRGGLWLLYDALLCLPLLALASAGAPWLLLRLGHAGAARIAALGGLAGLLVIVGALVGLAR